MEFFTKIDGKERQYLISRRVLKTQPKTSDTAIVFVQYIVQRTLLQSSGSSLYYLM